MPYPGIPDEKIEKMDSCVKKVMADGKDKDAAIAICHKQIMGKSKKDDKKKDDKKKKEDKEERSTELFEDLPIENLVEIFDDFTEGEIVNKNKREVRCMIIKAGMSLNRRYYGADVLRRAVSMYEGRKAYADHSENERSIREIVGIWKDVEFDEAKQGVMATFRCSDKPLWNQIEVTVDEGLPLVGVSHDAFGKVEQADDHIIARELTEIQSVDWVTDAAAGGMADHILASLKRKQEEEEKMKKDEKALEEEKRVKEEKEKLEKAEKETKEKEAKEAEEAEEAKLAEEDKKKEEKEVEKKKMATEEMEKAINRIKEMEDKLAISESEKRLDKEIHEAKLPEVIAEKIRNTYKGKEVSEEEIIEVVKVEKETLDELAKSTLKVTGNGSTKEGDLEIEIDEREKLQLALDGMFTSVHTRKPHTNDKGVKAYTSLKQAYVDITGDMDITGDPAVLRESKSRLFERIETSDFTYLMGTSMYRALIKDYEGMPFEWNQFTSIVPLNDLKQQDRIRYGAFGLLSAISEGASYPNLTEPGEERATYSPSKRGGKVEITWEMVLNDDLAAISRVPGKLAYATNITLGEFVYKFVTGTGHSSGAIYDGATLYNASMHTNVLAASTALSATSLQGSITSMRKFNDEKGKRIGVRPRHLLVPVEKEFAVKKLLASGADIDQANPAVINVVQGIVAPIIVPHFAHAKNWYLIADPASLEGLELGFVGGETPQLLLQDAPAAGKVFTNDVITYRVRHVYGGALLDYRAYVKGGNFAASM